MKKDLFTDGISHIDVDAVERLLQIEQNMQAKKNWILQSAWITRAIC